MLNNDHHYSPMQRQGLAHSPEIFKRAALGILYFDTTAKITEINPYALEIFGYEKEDVLGRGVEALIPLLYNNITSEKKLFDFQTRFRGQETDLIALKKDGTAFSVRLSLAYDQDDNKNSRIAFIKDVSSRKIIESQLNEVNRKLAITVEQVTDDLKNTIKQMETSCNKLESVLSFHKAILKYAGVMIIATDENGIIKLFNPEASARIGYHEAEVLNAFTPLLFHDSNEIARKRKELKDEFGITITNGFDVLVEKCRRNTHEEEQYTYLRKDGTPFPVSLTITAIRNDDEIIGFMGIAMDISERKSIEKELRNALEKERELGELKSRFISMASHEFRTPLSTILSSAYLIEKYITDSQPKVERHLQRIYSSVNMLTDILNDFLNVGRIEEGMVVARPGTTNIRDLVTSTAEEMKDSMKKGQEIYCYHEGDPIVFMDQAMLKHILMNLISNASKFSSETSAIDIRTINKRDQISLSVKDKGIGISKDDQKHLTERFFRGANAGNVQGTGLGLHIVSKYAELMSGKLECRSELDIGTEFIIKFKPLNLLS